MVKVASGRTLGACCCVICRKLRARTQPAHTADADDAWFVRKALDAEAREWLHSLKATVNFPIRGKGAFSYGWVAAAVF